MDGSVKLAKFNLELVKNKAVITREIEFANGDLVTFSVGVDPANLTLAELHRKSVESLVTQLQAWAAPQ